MALQFKKATKKSARGRMALIGPSGSGKTYTALTIASAMGGKVAVIDTERGSASKYSNLFAFDVLELESFAPQMFVDAIRAAEAAGYDILIIDSLSHAWMGRDGALEQVDRAAARTKSGSSFEAWRSVTPMHNALVDAIVQSRCHIIVTMRAKTEYVLEKNSSGKMAPRKVGLAAVQRDGLEYEFDVVADLDDENTFIVTKTRCPELKGATIRCAGADVAKTFAAWLADGEPAPVRAAVPAPANAPPPPESGAQATGDSVLPVPFFSKLIAEARTVEGLEKVGAMLKEAREHGAVDDAERRELIGLFAKRRNDLKVVQAAPEMEVAS